jgi:hypothetical protein
MGDWTMMRWDDGWDAEPRRASQPFEKPWKLVLAPVNHLRQPWNLVALPVNHLERTYIWSATVWWTFKRAAKFQHTYSIRFTTRPPLHARRGTSRCRAQNRKKPQNPQTAKKRKTLAGVLFAAGAGPGRPHAALCADARVRPLEAGRWVQV